MSGLVWLLILLCLGGAAWGVLHMRRRLEERRELESARAATFLAQAIPRQAAAPAVAADGPPAPEAQLLLDAAFKAGQAGEAALSIQLYARLISRFPASSLVAQARAGAEAQKKKLSIPKAPGPAAPG